MKNNWWKILAVVLLVYSIVAGLLIEVPRLAILNETIRNLFFHVPMWFSMIMLLLLSCIASVRYLLKMDSKLDLQAVEWANIGIMFGVLGILTGMFWAKFTWGDYWTNDPKLNGSAIGLLIYLAYFVLRGSLEDEQQRARISAVYNIFAFATLIPLLFILPRMYDSLHPGNGGNPGFNSYDLDSRLRMVFYPAVIGWILFGVWVGTIRYRLRLIQERVNG